MKRRIGTERDDIGSSTEIECLIANTPDRVSDYEVENPLIVFVTSKEAVQQIKAVQ